MLLPPPIQTYFDADQGSSVEALIQAFAPDAAVRDEGHTYAGRAAIVAWWRKTKTKYQTVVEPFEAKDIVNGSQILAKVTGDFPGSPATLRFTFTTEAGQIKRLEIGQ